MGAFRRNPRDRAIAALAIPALGTLAMDPLVSIVDTAWVGRLGTVALAALAIASAVFAAVFSIFNFVHMTVTPLVAGEVGRGDVERSGTIATGAVIVSFTLGIAVGALAIVFAEPIVSLFGAADDVASTATSYLRVRFLSLPFMLVAMVGHGVFRGHSDTRTPLYVAIGMNLLNLVLDPVLMFTFGLGVVGAAWATVVAQAAAALWFVALMFFRRREELGTTGRIGPLGDLEMGRILGSGWPMMLRSAALLAALTATTVAASRIGTDEVAAHQIAMQVWLFLSFVLDSYAVAAQAMVGTDLGAGDRGGARAISDRLLALGFVTGCGLSVALAVTAPLVPLLFSADEAVTAQLASIYPFVVVLQPITALVYVWDGIGIGASAFGYLAVSMLVAGALALGTLALVGDTLVGVWVGVLVLTLSRAVALGWWYVVGPLGHARGPFPVSPGA